MINNITPIGKVQPIIVPLAAYLKQQYQNEKNVDIEFKLFFKGRSNLKTVQKIITRIPNHIAPRTNIEIKLKMMFPL